MEVKPIFLVLADISGYTKFIKVHKVSLIHAEHIIDELLESVIREASLPLVVHELEGDAVTFYAQSDGRRETAREVARQVEGFFEAFRKREHELISECSMCVCDACTTVGRLKLKAIVHHGEAVFTRVHQFQKVSGEDVILAHRLLKNSVPKNEYLLVTRAFHQLGGGLDGRIPEPRTEHCEGLGEVDVMVYYPQTEADTVPAPASLGAKLKMVAKLEGLHLKRLIWPAAKRYPNLDAVQQ